MILNRGDMNEILLEVTDGKGEQDGGREAVQGDKRGNPAYPDNKEQKCGWILDEQGTDYRGERTVDNKEDVTWLFDLKEPENK